MIADFGQAEIEVILLSLRVAALAVAASLPLAIFAAYALARWSFAGRGALNVVVHLPLILPPVVTGYGLLLLLGPSAPLGRALHACCGLQFAFDWTGAAVAAGVMAFPLIVRSIRLALEAVDPGVEEAARTLGASHLRVLMTVTLPLAMPGILAGAVLAFAKAMGEFGATITFVASIPGETQTLSLAIWSALQVPGGEQSALRLLTVSIVLATGALVASELLARRLRGAGP